MMPYDVRIRFSRLGLLAALVLVTAGCPEDAAEITEPASPPSHNFPVTSTFAPPAGPFAIDRFALAEVDTSVSDAFARGRSLSTAAIGGISGCPTSDGACPGWQFPIRNATEDTRLPALQDDDAFADIMGVIHDSVFDVPLLVMRAFGLEPSTEYSITLERLAIGVAGGLDATHQLLNNPDFGGFALDPDAPDQLTRLDGAPGGNLGDNYYLIHSFTTNVAGESGFQAPAFAGTGANDMLETNALAAFDLPKYNYLVVYQGSPDDGVPVLRAQVGVDLDADGAPVNNALAPHPIAALTIAQVLAAPGGAGRPDSLSVVFNDLEELTGGAVYEAWLINPATGSARPATGTYRRLKIVVERDPVTGEIVSSTDMLVETVPGTASFVGGDQEDGFRHELVLSDPALGGGPADTIGFHTHLVLTIAEAAGGDTPPDARPIWFAYTDQRGTPGDFFDDEFTEGGVTRFGTFDPDEPSASMVYGGDGGGTGGFRADVLSVDLESLSRPPLGYAYVGWLVRPDGSAFRLPEITGPPPARRSLVDADVQTVSGLVTETGILSANLRVEADVAGIQFADFESFVLTLESKMGAPGLGSIPTHSGTVPARVRS